MFKNIRTLPFVLKSKVKKQEILKSLFNFRKSGIMFVCHNNVFVFFNSSLEDISDPKYGVSFFFQNYQLLRKFVIEGNIFKKHREYFNNLEENAAPKIFEQNSTNNVISR